MLFAAWGMNMTTRQLEIGDFVTPTVRLVRPLAEGGMGRVWVAEHLGLHCQVVVKLMAEEMAARSDGAERFAREAAIAAAIKSPHVVQVFDHGVTADGVPYIVMDLLEGKDLGAHLTSVGRMDPLDVVTLVVQIGKALSRAHRASVVHRDIKPDNIFLCDTEGGEIFVKLLDFGTAKQGTAAGSRTTVPGQIMGTPYYMSPEQSVGSTEIDARSDIWSLGVVAYEALTGQRPFDGASVGAITIAIHGALPKMTDAVPHLSSALDAWFAKSCAQQAEDRFDSVREATSAFVEAVTGAAPVDLATESVCFPPVEAKGGSTPVRPFTRPIEPLIASLPDRNSERRFTTIAAGAVMAVAGIAMAVIVAGRSSPAAPEGETPTTTAAHVEAPGEPTPALAAEPPGASPAPPAEPASAPVVDGKRAGASAPIVDAKPAGAKPVGAHAPSPRARPVAPSTASTAAGAKHATPSPPLQHAGGVTPPRDNDDDLVRLTKAAAKHADPAPPASAAPAVTPSATTPPFVPPPLPAAPTATPAPALTPLP